MEHLSNVSPDYTLWVLLGQTRDLLRKVRQRELNQYGISIRQGFTLSIIKAMGNKATPTSIARRQFREPHSVSELLNRMEKKGLVRKSNDPHSKTLVRVGLTKKGLEVYRQTIKLESVHKIISSLSEEDREKLRSCLQVLMDKALKELGIPPPEA